MLGKRMQRLLVLPNLIAFSIQAIVEVEEVEDKDEEEVAITTIIEEEVIRLLIIMIATSKVEIGNIIKISRRITIIIRMITRRITIRKIIKKIIKKITQKITKMIIIKIIKMIRKIFNRRTIRKTTRKIIKREEIIIAEIINSNNIISQKHFQTDLKMILNTESALIKRRSSMAIYVVVHIAIIFC